MLKSVIVFEGFGYLACYAAKGQILAVTRGDKGKYLKGQEAIEWAESIKTAIDNREAAALCKAIYNS